MADGLEEQALERKAKLQALSSKAKRGGQASSNSGNEGLNTESAPSTRPVLKFRNYTPSSAALKEKQLPKAKPEDVEEQISGHVKQAKEMEAIPEVNLTNLAPRKPAWDLKRDISSKQAKLARRKQRAIFELTRERIEQEQLSSVDSSSSPLTTGLAAVVRAGTDNKADYDSE